MKIALLGDAHGRIDLLQAAAQRAQDEFGAGMAIQMGDLGFFESLLGAGRPLPRLPIPVLAVCGNHEEHDFLTRARRSGLCRYWAERGLVYQPRGSVAWLDGHLAGFLGGAMHVDRRQEALNRPTPEQIQTALDTFNAARPELIFTHSCPSGIGIGMRGSDAFARSVHEYVRQAGIDPGPPDDCGEPGLQALWNGLARKPRLWVFGHFHRYHQATIQNTLFLGCPALEESLPMVVWDSHTWHAEIHDRE